MVEPAKGYNGVTVESLNLPEGIDAAVRELVRGGPTPGIDNDSEFQLVKDTLEDAARAVADTQKRLRWAQGLMNAYGMEKTIVYDVKGEGETYVFKEGEFASEYTIDRGVNLKRRALGSDKEELIEHSCADNSRNIAQFGRDATGVYVMFQDGKVGIVVRNEREGKNEIKYVKFGSHRMVARRLIVYRGHVSAEIGGNRSGPYHILQLHERSAYKGARACR